MTTLFRPSSPCGPACLAESAPAVGPLRCARRLVTVVGVLAAAMVAAPLLAACPAMRRRAFVGQVSRWLLRALGIRLQLRGVLPARGALVVADHTSFLDVLALLAVPRRPGHGRRVHRRAGTGWVHSGQVSHRELRLLAKAEVCRWPLIGVLARYAGTIFIDRDRPRQLPQVVSAVAAALAAGDVVAAFPEGTTSCGAHPIRYRPAIFQAALDAGVPVVPLRLGFELADGQFTPLPAYVGQESLWSSVLRVAHVAGLVIRLAPAAAMHPGPAASRRALARVASTAVRLGVVTAAGRPGEDWAGAGRPSVEPRPTETRLPLAA